MNGRFAVSRNQISGFQVRVVEVRWCGEYLEERGGVGRYAEANCPIPNLVADRNWMRRVCDGGGVVVDCGARSTVRGEGCWTPVSVGDRCPQFALPNHDRRDL